MNFFNNFLKTIKNYLKKPWFVPLFTMTTLLVVIIFNLWLVSLELKIPYTHVNFWGVIDLPSASTGLVIFAYLIQVAVFLSILPILFTVFSLFRKTSFGYRFAVIYFMSLQITYILFQATTHYLSGFAIVLVIFNILLVLALFSIYIYAKKGLTTKDILSKKPGIIDLKHSKIPLFVLIIDLVAILFIFTTFFIPLFTLEEGREIYRAIGINVLLAGDTHLINMGYFFVNFFFILLILLYFSKIFSDFFYDKVLFIKSSRKIVFLSFIASLVFFLSGLGIKIYYTFEEEVVTTVSYIPVFLALIVVFIYAGLKGKFSIYFEPNEKNKSRPYSRIESLFYVLVLSAITSLMYFLNILKISLTANTYIRDIELTGFAILRDYIELDEGFRIIAFLLLVILISVGVGLVISIASYLSKNKGFYKIVKFVTVMNIFFVFIVGISGFYFQIAKEINQEMLLDLIEYTGVNIPSSFQYTYKIGTDAIYALIAALFVLVLMFFRKTFDQDDLESLKNELEPAPEVYPESNLLPSFDSGEVVSFDPCPAFSELDAQVQDFKHDLSKRKKYKVSKPSLNDMVYFIVEYAKNSRLHLSYTHEDIATFVAGLGASKLTILQGMSGTGKTSLPKIFAEAIFGNCEIIEVESSWKDKNELLGYYNEFSMKYTPKKFTLALYKAALNPEITTFILLDEMNLSRIEYYFSDFLSLMENEEENRLIKLVNVNLYKQENKQSYSYLNLIDGHTLKVPSNIWFIGTANRDESTFVISDKVYDRAHTMNFMHRAPKVRNYTAPIDQRYYDYKTIKTLFDQAKANGGFDAENHPLIKQVEELLKPYNISFGNRILKQIEDFVVIYKACFPHEDVEQTAIETILLSKVVAKLELKVVDDIENLEQAFSKLGLLQCVEFIKQLDSD